MPLLRPRAVRADKPGPGRVPVAAAEDDKNLKAVIKWIPTELIGFYQASIDWWKPWMGTVLLLLGGILLPVIDGILKALGLTQGE